MTTIQGLPSDISEKPDVIYEREDICAEIRRIGRHLNLWRAIAIGFVLVSLAELWVMSLIITPSWWRPFLFGQ
jgi:hypothetical protein